MSDSATTRYRICPLCEATCGLELQTEGRVVTAVRGEVDDVFSLGFICPKGAALKELDADPDRLREPLVRRDGRLVPVGWDEAFAEIERRLIPILEEHGKDSLATYLGNPSVHNADLAIYYQVLATVLPSRNRFTASTVDQIPKHVSCGLMFGGYLSIPIPDIDRCDYLLMLGANPMVSNGSLFTAPDFRGRVRAMHGRGGRLIVVDPRRTETARLADRHVFIRPGTVAYLLIGLARTHFVEGLVKIGQVRKLR